MGTGKTARCIMWAVSISDKMCQLSGSSDQMAQWLSKALGAGGVEFWAFYLWQFYKRGGKSSGLSASPGAAVAWSSAGIAQTPLGIEAAFLQCWPKALVVISYMGLLEISACQLFSKEANMLVYLVENYPTLFLQGWLKWCLNVSSSLYLLWFFWLISSASWTPERMWALCVFWVCLGLNLALCVLNRYSFTHKSLLCHVRLLRHVQCMSSFTLNHLLQENVLYCFMNYGIWHIRLCYELALRILEQFYRSWSWSKK